jgi:hypothetical protein
MTRIQIIISNNKNVLHLQINLKIRQMNWLIGRKSQLTTANKLLLCKVIIKPIWSYGIQLWD